MTSNTLSPRQLGDTRSGGLAPWGNPDEKSESLVALTTDPAFLAVLRRLASPQELRAVSRETDFGRALLASPTTLAIIDCSALTRFPVDQVTRLLLRQFPHLHLVVVGTARDQAALAEQLADGQIHSFLHKPVTATRLRPVIDAVLQPLASPSESGAPEQRSGGRTWVIAAVALVVLAGGAYALRSYLAPEAQAPAAATENPLEDLLAHADAALAGGGYDNAIELYRKAQQVSPGDQRIAEGLSRVGRRLLQAAQTQLRDHHVEEARTLARQAAALAPDAPQLAALLDQIEGSQDHPASVSALATPSEPRSRALDDRLRQAQELMRQGHLLDPQQGSARSVLRLAREMAPADPRIGEAQRQLLSLVVAEARKMLATGHPEDADRLITAATELGARPDEIDDLKRQALRDKANARSDALERVVLLFNERLQQGRLLEPATDSAKFYLAQLMSRDPASPATQIARMALGTRLLAEASGAARRKDLPAARSWLEEARAAGADAASMAPIEADLVMVAPQPAAQSPAQPPAEVRRDGGSPNISLQKTHDVEPVYPKEALRRQVRGKVELAYTVRADGHPDDFTVISAQPPGIFDQAAVEAARQWRYRPPRLPNGKPTQVTTRAIIHFAP
jgi:TonB family protein